MIVSNRALGRTMVGALLASFIVLIAGAQSSHHLAPLATGLGVFGMALCAWLGAQFSTQGQSYPSRLSMLKSQWQVPLYAALAVYATTVLGSYLSSLGASAACTGWPICAEVLQPGTSWLVAAHMAHRAAAALAGLLLLYTVGFVWRRHTNRPLVLALTASAVVLFTGQVVLGAETAAGGMGGLAVWAHLAIAAGLVCNLIGIAAVGYYMPSLPSITGAAQVLAIPTVSTDLSVGKTIRAYVDLTKPRILVLLLITGYAAMWVAAKGLPSLGLTLITMLGLGMSCGAANAINMWYDQDIDQVMSRTKKRPIPAGRLSPEQVLSFGLITGTLSFILLAFAVNLVTALLSLSGLLFYVLIYTMWLKRSTVQNIVIGGAAGAIPPLVGWAAVTGQVSWAGIAMFMIVFMWTPPHFWALALFRNEDYTRAGVPMMPVIKGERYTKWHILVYGALLFPTVLSLYWTGVVGQVYMWIALIATVAYFGSTVALFFERLPVQKWAVRSFIWSLFYLSVVFVAAVIDTKG